MNAMIGKAGITGLLFLLILGSGCWLSCLGKPYNSLVFNLHKLIGLGTGVFLIVMVVRAGRVSPLQPAALLAIVLTGIIFLLLAAAGGLLSVMAEGGLASLNPGVQKTISLVHRVFPYLALLSTAAAFFLALRQY